MSNQKQTLYNIDAITAENAIYNLIYGERSNGKSYQVKHKKGILKYINEHRRFILLRRWKEEISSEKIEQYFADVDVTGLTQGRYNCITMYKRQLFFSTYDFDKNKTGRGEKIGYVMSLNTEQNYAGASYLDVDDIIFEEFMARGAYIPHESDKLANLWSTVDRKRGTTKVWMVGNTISRVCPYISDWGLHKIISNQKQGTIKTLDVPAGTDDAGNPLSVKMAIEYCKSSGKSSMAIGKHKDMLNSGSWQSDPQPHLPKSLKCYTSRFSFIFMYQDFKFVCSYLEDNDDGNVCWFVKPYDGEIKDDSIVISDQVRVSPYWQRNIYDTTFANPRLNEIFQTFRESKIFYATDLCGTDFKQVIDFAIRK